MNNQRALDKYNASYNNQTYQAIKKALWDADIFDSPCYANDHVVTDFMNLVTDAALWRCGHSDYIGTLDCPISKAMERIEARIAHFGTGWAGCMATIRAAVDAHLNNFPELTKPKPKNAISQAFSEFKAAKGEGVLPASLELIKEPAGYRVGFFDGKGGFETRGLFTYSTGLMIWLERCTQAGHMVVPTIWESYVRVVTTNPVYALALKASEQR